MDNRQRPNILWLTYEDTSPQFLGCYGNSIATTPHIDRLAGEGVRFTQAYATAPVCSASRCTIITGCSTEALGTGNHRSQYAIPGYIKGFPYYLRQAGYYVTNNVKTDYNVAHEREFIAETWDESSVKAGWWGRQPGQPFFSVFNYIDSHQSRTMTKPWRWYEENVLAELPEAERISPADIELPPFYRDTPEMRRHVSRVYNSLRLTDRRIRQRLDQLEADGLLDDTIVFVFADHGEGIPRGKCNAIGFGYRAPFVLWLPEKYRHLSPWGTGVVTDELVSFEDLAPTVLSLAGIPIPDHMTGRSFLGEYRVPPRQYVYASRNRIDDTPDLCRSVMDGRFVYTRNFFPHLPVMKYQKYGDVGEITQAIRRDYREGMLNEVQAELVCPTRPTEYLYDINADPWEIRNLADDPAYQADLSRLRQACMDRIASVADVMFLPEGEMVARSNGTTAYEIRKDAELNPLPDLLQAAELVGKGAAALPEQLRLLKHGDAAVRYWAAVGICAAYQHLQEYRDELAAVLARDPAPCVQIELAAAMYAAYQDTQAKQILEAFITGADPYSAHQAIQRAMYLPSHLAGDFVPAVAQVRDRFREVNHAEGMAYPVQTSAEMFMHIYNGDPLFYIEDKPWLGQPV